MTAQPCIGCGHEHPRLVAEHQPGDQCATVFIECPSCGCVAGSAMYALRSGGHLLDANFERMLWAQWDERNAPRPPKADWAPPQARPRRSLLDRIRGTR